MGVRNREGVKMMEEKCLQMRQTEKEEVNVQFEKVKAACFQNGSEKEDGGEWKRGL